MKLRFEQFNDLELYILKRAFIEATKYIYQQEEITYTEDELDLLNNLLVEAIDNIKARELIEKKRFEVYRGEEEGEELMRPLTDILERFKDRSAEELKAYFEGYNQAFIDMQNEKIRQRKEALEMLRRHQSFPRASSVPSQETNAAATSVSTDSHPKHLL